MAEFPSEQDDQESYEAAERAADYRAMPLRIITMLVLEGKMAVLDCGHVQPLRARLLVGDTVRCRACYEFGLLKAQRMVEGQ